MQSTSHFLWMEINSDIIGDAFINVQKYLRENNIEDSFEMQNPLSPHITLYYFEQNIPEKDIYSIKTDIKKLDVSKGIFFTGVNYFYRNDKKILLYFTTKTELLLKEYRDMFHEKYRRNNVSDNSLIFSPHITFLRILNSDVYEKHRENIEEIISHELAKIKNSNAFTKNIYLYKVNSTFPWQIQLKID